MFSQRLAKMVNQFQRALDDRPPSWGSECDCSTSWGELGAWIFTCRNCFELGLTQLEREARCEDSLQLEVDLVAEPTAPPERRP